MHRRVFKGILSVSEGIQPSTTSFQISCFGCFFFAVAVFLTVWFAFLFFCSLEKSSRPSTQLNSDNSVAHCISVCNISRYIYPQWVCSLSFSNRPNRPCLTKIFQWYLTRHLPSEKFRLSSTDKNCNSFPCPWNFPLYMNYPISSRLFSGYI